MNASHVLQCIPATVRFTKWVEATETIERNLLLKNMSDAPVRTLFSATQTNVFRIVPPDGAAAIHAGIEAFSFVVPPKKIVKIKIEMLIGDEYEPADDNVRDVILIRSAGKTTEVAVEATAEGAAQGEELDWWPGEEFLRTKTSSFAELAAAHDRSVASEEVSSSDEDEGEAPPEPAPAPAAPALRRPLGPLFEINGVHYDSKGREIDLSTGQPVLRDDQQLPDLTPTGAFIDTSHTRNGEDIWGQTSGRVGADGGMRASSETVMTEKEAVLVERDRKRQAAMKAAYEELGITCLPEPPHYRDDYDEDDEELEIQAKLEREFSIAMQAMQDEEARKKELKGFQAQTKASTAKVTAVPAARKTSIASKKAASTAVQDKVGNLRPSRIKTKEHKKFQDAWDAIQ